MNCATIVFARRVSASELDEAIPNIACHTGLEIAFLTLARQAGYHTYHIYHIYYTYHTYYIYHTYPRVPQCLHYLSYHYPPNSAVGCLERAAFRGDEGGLE